MPTEHTPVPVSFSANGRDYRAGPGVYAVVCIDGGSDEYLDAALVRGLTPNLQRMIVRGARFPVRAAMPTFTNPNNTSIVTGVPPRLHGVGGNYFFDEAAGRETMMNSAEFVRCGTILAAAMEAGRRVAVVTAKDKLRGILSKGLDPAAGNAVSLSAEKSGEARRETHGVSDAESLGGPTPLIYSAEASLWVLRAGVALVERGLADLLYLSLTDYMQHKHAPADPEVLRFYAEIDRQLGAFDALGVTLGITADHGMNAKQNRDGDPSVVYLESQLKERFGAGVRVILPITDPYVVHHGGLGSFAVVHLPDGVSERDAETFIAGLPGVTEVHPRARAARLLELPEDRIGDLVVLSARDVVIGKSPESHDLSVLRRADHPDAPSSGLRSHGGRYEEIVPMVINRPLNPRHAHRSSLDPRTFDIFDFTLNGTAA